MDLPVELGYGTVNGRFLVAVRDEDDQNLAPDGEPVRGQVVFTASIEYATVPVSSSGPQTIIFDQIVGVFDDQGYLCTPHPKSGNPMYRGISLTATDDSDLSVTGWTWKATYQLQSSDRKALKIPDHSFAVPDGSMLDLATLVSIPSTPGYGLPQAEASALRAETIAQSIREDADSGKFNGTAATIEVGTVTSGSAPSVSNGGTGSHAVLNFVLQKGDKGDTGVGVPGTGSPLQVMRMTESGTQTEWVTPSKTIVGLGNVDNTSDENKPVSISTQAALDSKVSTIDVLVKAGDSAFTDGSIVQVGAYAFVLRPDVNMSVVMGGGVNNENVVGGNFDNVNTATSNLIDPPTLTGTDGQWCFINNGYDNVANGWAIILNGFHNRVGQGANHATIAGGSIHTIESNVNYSTIGGGTGNVIKTGGSAGTIAGGINGELSGSSATLSGGTGNKSNGFHSTVGGGGNNQVTGNMSATISGGENGVASGAGSVIPGGNDNTASGYHSTAAGRGAIAGSNGMRSYGAKFTTNGDAQDSTVIMKRETTDATATGLSLDGSAGLVIPVDTTWAIDGLIVARRTDADGESASFKFDALLKRDAGNTAGLVGTPVVTKVLSTAGNTWTVTIGSATAGNLNITVTGEAGKTIRWLVTLRIAHVSG